jgi:glycosyl transferase family 25
MSTPQALESTMSKQIPQTLADALPPGTGACIINLDARVDRWEALQQQILTHFKGLELQRISAITSTQIPGFGKAPYFRGSGRDQTWGARGGCTLSHREALLHAKSKGWSHVLILEDDIQIDANPDPNFLEALQRALQSMHFDVCYFGYTDPEPPFKHLTDLDAGRSVYRIFGCNTTPAYLVKATAADWIVDRLPSPSSVWPWIARHRAVDRFYLRNLSPSLSVLAISPSLIIQRPCFSDILGKSVAACRENHRIGIDSSNLEPFAFQKQMKSKAKKFKRLEIVDRVRSLWKVLTSF